MSYPHPQTVWPMRIECVCCNRDFEEQGIAWQAPTGACFCLECMAFMASFAPRLMLAMAPPKKERKKRKDEHPASPYRV